MGKMSRLGPPCREPATAGLRRRGFRWTAGILCACVAWPPPASAQPASTAGAQGADGWELLASLPVGHGSRTVKGATLHGRLPLGAEAAFLDWGRFAQQQSWRVSIDPEGGWLLVGSAPGAAFEEAGNALDAAGALLVGLRPPAAGGDDAEGNDGGDGPAGAGRDATGSGPDAAPVTCFLFDEPASRSAAWEALLAALVERRAMDARMADALRADPAGFTLRTAGIFVQPAFDQAGNAAAGDDEFRLGNEVAHKYAQCVLRRRFGVQPEMVRWGIGYVVEQRLFGTSYQFGQSGFVAAASHADWAERAADELKEAAKDKGFRFSPLVARSADAGGAGTPQLLVWAGLDALLAKDPKSLSGMLADLATLQRQADAYGLAFDWLPSAEDTAAACAPWLDGLDPKALGKALAKRKPAKVAKKR